MRALASAAERGVTALAVATLLGIALEAIRPGSALHPHFIGSTGSAGLDTAIASAFAALVLLPPPTFIRFSRASRIASAVVGAIVIGLAGRSLGRQALALIDGRLHATGWAPPATLVAIALAVPWTIRASSGHPISRPRGRRSIRIAGVAAAGVALVFAQLAAVGTTDYRERADAILVLGSKVNADGTPSGSLLDRTRTACALWREGLAPLLVLSGGRDPKAAAGEPEVMRRIARAEGAPDAAIILDETGADTASSVRFAATLSRERGWSRMLVVSHDYHLAREASGGSRGPRRPDGSRHRDVSVRLEDRGDPARDRGLRRHVGAARLNGYFRSGTWMKTPLFSVARR